MISRGTDNIRIYGIGTAAKRLASLQSVNKKTALSTGLCFCNRLHLYSWALHHRTPRSCCQILRRHARFALATTHPPHRTNNNRCGHTLMGGRSRDRNTEPGLRPIPGSTLICSRTLHFGKLRATGPKLGILRQPAIHHRQALECQRNPAVSPRHRE